MTTLSLRSLVRDPRKVKRMTGTGKAVQVADRGKPLWIVQPVVSSEHEAERLRITDQILEEVLRGRPSKITAARLLEESRR
jgi:hypothetical protein